MQKYTDEELVALYKESKNTQYLTILFTKYSDIVYRTAMRVMKNTSDAEDIMQTSYIKMIRDLHLFKGTGSVLGWMLQVVIHTCYQQKNSEKSRTNREKLIMSERPTTTSPTNNDLSETIENHLNKLPEIYKVPITLQIMEGLSIKEVSQALEIPEKTIRSQIARGLEKLKVSLQGVGITASVMMIGDVLKEIPMQVAPATLKSSSYFQTIFHSKTAASTKIAITVSSKSFFYSKVLVAIGLIGIFLGGYFYWNTFAKQLSPTSFVGESWDFENTTDITKYQNIKLAYGGISIVKGMGVDNSNGLVIDANTLIEFDVSKLKWPLQISYKLETLITSSREGQMIFKNNYNRDKNLMLATELRPAITLLSNNSNTRLSALGYLGKWIDIVNFVSDDRVAVLVEGRLSQMLYGVSSDKNKILFLIKGHAILDDIKIESIDETKLLDTSNIDKEVYSVKIQDDVKKYNLNKEKIGIPINDGASPSIALYSPIEFGEKILSNQPSLSARLGDTKEIEWTKLRKKKYKSWSFKSAEDLKDLKVLLGDVLIENKIGINKSAVLNLPPNSILEVDISEFELPIRLTQVFDNKLSLNEKSKGVLIVKNNYEVQRNIFNFSGLGGVKIINTSEEAKKNKNENVKEGYFGQWFERVVYISKDCVDCWSFGERSSVLYGSSYDNKKLYLVIYDQTIIDHITIESIPNSELPDTSLFKKFVKGIPFKYGSNGYPVDKKSLGITKDLTPLLGIYDKYSLEYNMTAIRKLAVENSSK